MTTIEERGEYLNNPYFTGHMFGNFTPFYVTIAICTVVLGLFILFNIVFCCCSKHKYYWRDRNTGNLQLMTLWSATPRHRPPLDLTHLQGIKVHRPLPSDDSEHPEYVTSTNKSRGYDRAAYQHHLQLEQHHQQQKQLPQRHGEEYVELHKRESDI